MLYYNTKTESACKPELPAMKNLRPLKAKYGLLTRQCCTALAILMCPLMTNANNTSLTVITDIAPVHSLASMVMGETGSPHMLVPPSQSPHHFALKPSQVRLLSSGDLVIFIDDEFTPPLTRQINATNNDISRLELNSTLRVSTTGSDDNHADHDADQHSTEHEEHGDLHTWLNPRNAITWIQHIAHALSALDNENAEVYKLNAQESIAQLTLLDETLMQQLKGLNSEPYLVYHDAYQHFAAAFKLAPAESIAISDARKPGARRLAAMRKKARSVRCVFSESQHSDALVNTVTVGLDVKRGILDPIGSNLDSGPALYTGLLTQLADSFASCLGPEK